ncbi:MAG TPA: hypothetical protein VHA11_02560 [Bryobacteraceae bacterium]|nr:hypothetical protein [Bryobacteraceae bacterium]
MIRTSAFSACLLAVSFAGAQPQSDDPAALDRIRAGASEALAKIHNCACLWTVDLSGWSRDKMQWRERYRLEMAFLDDKEVFAWPGAKAFESRGLTDAIHQGAISTGDLAIILYNIFVADSATIHPDGRDALAGRPLLRYSFEVPLLRSKMRLRAGNDETPVAYGGTFWADPGTYALHRMEIRAGIPGVTMVRTIDYQQAALEGDTAYLPAAVRMTATHPGGNQSRSTLTRGECRKFTAESALSFDEASPGAGAAPPANAAPALPAGLSLNLKLDAEIDVETAAAGDRITASLEGAVNSGSLALARRSPVHGRVTRAFQSWAPDRGARLGLTFHEAGGEAPVSLKCSLALRSRPNSGGMLETGGLAGKVAVPPQRPELTFIDNVLWKESPRLVLPRGFRLICTTL